MATIYECYNADESVVVQFATAEEAAQYAALNGLNVREVQPLSEEELLALAIAEAAAFVRAQFDGIKQDVKAWLNNLRFKLYFKDPQLSNATLTTGITAVEQHLKQCSLTPAITKLGTIATGQVFTEEIKADSIAELQAIYDKYYPAETNGA